MIPMHISLMLETHSSRGRKSSQNTRCQFMGNQFMICALTNFRRSGIATTVETLLRSQGAPDSKPFGQHGLLADSSLRALLLPQDFLQLLPPILGV